MPSFNFTARIGRKKVYDGSYALKFTAHVDTEKLKEVIEKLSGAIKVKFLEYFQRFYSDGDKDVEVFIYKFPQMTSSILARNNFIRRNLRPANMVDLLVLFDHSHLFKRRVVIACEETFNFHPLSLVLGGRENPALDFRGGKIEFKMVDTISASSSVRRYFCYMALRH